MDDADDDTAHPPRAVTGLGPADPPVTVDPAGRAWTADEIAEASAAELSAGRLPLRAQWRIAEQRGRRDRGEPGSFTSALSVEEFAAVRSVGFTPVGQVMGSAVYKAVRSFKNCGYYRFGRARGEAGSRHIGSRPWADGTIPVVSVPATQEMLGQARHRAVERLRQECAGLGGDGVVGVQLTVKPLYPNTMEFVAVGTAVRADGGERPAKPFTSNLTGQDFATLIRAGWVPVALVQGVAAMIRHSNLSTAVQRGSLFNQEINGLTRLLEAAREAARTSLATDAQHEGGHTVLLRDTTLQVSEQPCTLDHCRDHLANCFMWGTAVVPFDVRSPIGTPLPMMRL